MSVNYRTVSRFVRQKGLNDRDPNLLLGPGVASSLKNAYFPGGYKIKKRPGMEKLNSVTAGAYVNTGLYVFRPEGVVPILIACFSNGKIYKMEGIDGTLDEIGTGFNTDTGASWCFATMTSGADTYCLMGNGLDYMQKWKVGDAAVTQLVTKRSNLFASFHNFLVMVEASSRNTVIWSAYFDPTTYPAANTLVIDTGNNDIINAVARLGQYVYLCKSESVKRLYFTGNMETEANAFAYEDALDGYGSLTQKGVAVSGSQFITLLNNNDFMAWGGGGEPISLFDAIKTTWGTITKSVITRCSAAFYQGEKMVLLTVPVNTLTYQTKVLVYDVANKAPLVFDGWNLNNIVRYVNSGVETMIGGCSDATGFLYKLFTGTNDIGSAIDFEDATGWDACGSPDVLKYFRFVRVYVKQQGNYNLDLYFKVARKDTGFVYGDGEKQSINLLGNATSLGTTYIIGTSPLGGEECLIATVPIERWGEQIMLKFKNNAAGEDIDIYGYEIQFEPVRVN